MRHTIEQQQMTPESHKIRRMRRRARRSQRMGFQPFMASGSVVNCGGLSL